MVNLNLNQHPEQSQRETDPWGAELSASLPKHKSVTPAFPLDLQPILSPAGIPGAPTLSAGFRGKSPTVQSLLRWDLKLSPTSHTITGLRDALALLMWRASILQLSQTLIEEELRLKACHQGKLGMQIQKALALLFWLGQDDAMMPA